MYPYTPSCPWCEAPTVQIHLSQGDKPLPPAVVVFEAPDGSLRFPGDTHGSGAEKYASQGFVRREYRGFAEVRNLEKRVNAEQSAQIRQRVERQQQRREAVTSEHRSRVFEGLKNGFQIPETDAAGERTGRMKTVRMSEHGKDVMREMIERNNKRSGPRVYDPGFRVEAYSDNRSNREGGRNR